MPLRIGLMKNKPTRAKLPVFAQPCKLIPGQLVPNLAREHGIDKQARTFTPWSLRGRQSAVLRDQQRILLGRTIEAVGAEAPPSLFQA